MNVKLKICELFKRFCCFSLIFTNELPMSKVVEQEIRPKCYLHILLVTFQTFQLCSNLRYYLVVKNTVDILRTKEMLNLVFS